MARSGPSKRLNVILLPDIHTPAHDEQAIDAVCESLESQHVDALIFGGDVVDNELLGRFVDGKPGAIEGRRVKEDYATARAIVARIAAAARKVNKKCQVIFLKGNHETRTDTFYQKEPKFKGMFDIPTELRLAEQDIQYVECDDQGDVYRLEWQGGKVVGVVRGMNDTIDHPGITFTHGWFHGKHNAEAHATAFGWGDIYYVHVHTAQLFTINTYGRRKRQGATVGCLCLLNPPYTRKSPCTRWVHGFGQFTIDPARPHHYGFVIRRIIDGVVY